MSPSLDELRLVLSEHSSSERDLDPLARRAKQAGRRVQRRRVAGSSLLAVALLGAGAMFAMSPLSESDVSPASSEQTATPSAVLPEYQHGFRLIQSVEVKDPLGATLAFVAGTRPLALGDSCFGVAPFTVPDQPDTSYEDTAARVYYNGQVRAGSSCSQIPEAQLDGLRGGEWPALSGSGFSVLERNSYWPMEPGDTITLRYEWADGVPRAGSGWSMGLYEKVAPDEYYPPLDCGANEGRAVSDTPIDHSGRMLAFGRSSEALDPGWEYSFPSIEHGLWFGGEYTAQGEFAILANGKRVFEFRTDPYECNAFPGGGNSTFSGVFTLKELGIESGDPLKVEFTGSGFERDSMRVALYDSADHGNPLK